MKHPAEALSAAIERAGSPVCVGLDPVLESLPESLRARHHEPVGAIAEFSRGVLRALVDEARRPVVAGVKFQSACFERYGSKGFAVMEEMVAEAVRLGLVVIWDAKRGDISTSAAHYAAAVKRLGAHWVTVNAYMGASCVQPFLEAGLGVFALVRTSNPDSDAVQDQRLADGRSVGDMMAELVAGVGGGFVGSGGMSALGAVVGATKSGDAEKLRGLMPRQIFLVPGYGAQGGTAADIRAMVRPDEASASAGVLVTASRSVIYAAGDDWEGAVRAAARSLACEVAGVVKG